MDKKTLIKNIKESDEWCIGALLTLYHCQTNEEKTSHSTKTPNGFGFNGPDSSIMTSYSKFYLNRGFLTTKQLIVIRSKIYKYINQLLNFDVQPVEIKKQKTDNNHYPIKESLTVDIVENNKKLEIKFSYPKSDRRFIEMVNTIKSDIEGRNWKPEKKCWQAIANLTNIEKLKKIGFEFSNQLNEFYKNNFSYNVEKITKIEGMNGTLRQFQCESIEFAESRNGRALLALDMGLGKTLTSYAFLQHKKETSFPVIVGCPASVKLGWVKEEKKWFNNSTTFVFSGRSKLYIPKKDIYIVNYDIIKDHVEDLINLKAKTLILDEVHFINNAKAQRSKAIRKISKNIENIIGLSGTPILNKPIEFFNFLNMLRPDIFSSWWKFANRYCDPQPNFYSKSGLSFNGASNVEELHKILTENVMIRFMKEDVLKELPKKTKTVIPVEITNKKEYENLWNSFKKDHILFNPDKKRNKTEELLQCLAKGKMKPILSWIENFISTGEKLVVFAVHHKVIDEVINYFKKQKVGIVKLDGRDDMNKKQIAIEKFMKDDKIKIFVGNVKAAGTGIDGLQEVCSNSIFMELDKGPSLHDQAEDRLLRFGQTKPVNVWYFVANETYEEYVINNWIDYKRQVITSLLDGKKVEKELLLTDLLNEYLKNN